MKTNYQLHRTTRRAGRKLRFAFKKSKLSVQNFLNTDLRLGTPDMQQVRLWDPSTQLRFRAKRSVRAATLARNSHSGIVEWRYCK